jgi:hypothetical protein
MLEILPESQGNILGVKVAGKFTIRDCQELLIPRLNPLIQEHGRVRVLFFLDEDFQGFDLEALQQEAFGPQHRDDFQKIAVVGASWWLSLQMKLVATLINGEVRNFSRAELPEAWTWIRG